MATLSNNGIVKLDGVTFRCKPGLTVTLGGEEKEAQVDAAGNVDAMVTRVAGGIEFTIPAADDTDIAFLKAFRGTATAEFLDSGKVYTGGGAFVTNNLSISGGELSVTIACREMIEQ
jgi:hypothetical protein